MEIEPGDVATYASTERFDVVTCLFGAIAYVRTPERLAPAIANLAALLAPGGQLLVEAFLAPADFVAGRPHAVFVDEPDLKLARMNVSKRLGAIAIIDFHYMLATGPGGVEREFERHEVGLFEVAQYRAAFEAAGLEWEALAEPAFPRGLFRGCKPTP
jgi:SAM-dependent methyltransferase